MFDLRISRLLRPERIALGASAADRLCAIDQLISLHRDSGILTDSAQYRLDVLAREDEGSTALGHQLAVPHGKSGGVREPALAAMVLDRGVDWDAPDGAPCRLLFLIAAPKLSADLHLQILARLMRLLIDEPLRARLLAAPTPQRFLSALAEQERDIFPHDFL